jgi:hypothetical protein
MGGGTYLARPISMTHEAAQSEMETSGSTEFASAMALRTYGNWAQSRPDLPGKEPIPAMMFAQGARGAGDTRRENPCRG